MKYRELAGEQVSILGFGLMRLPVINGDGANIDKEKTTKMIKYAIDKGINYFDTAYVYHGEKSEVIAGEIFEENKLRDKIKIATKLPTWHVKSEKDVMRLLDEQLERLRTDHIDFYLCHALDRKRFDDIILKYNVLPQLEKAKAEGKIKHIGFSFHDDCDAFKHILDSYDGWEFCQIQLNYINTDYQAGLEGLRYAAEEKGLGVIIMEPLYGGKLADPSEQIVRELPDGKSPVESAFDFLWNRPEVRITLSGMGTMQMVTDNIEYASRAEIGMLSDSDIEAFARAKHVFDTMALVPCTRCAYCMPCPFGVDIPAVYEAYNKIPVSGEDKAKEMYAAINGNGSKCVSCGACRRVCPQSIMTPVLMKKVHEKLG